MDTVDTLSDRLLQARILLRAFSPDNARRKVNELIAEHDLPLFAIERTRRFLLSLDATDSIPPEFLTAKSKSGAGVALKNAFAKAGITLTKEPIKEPAMPIDTMPLPNPVISDPEPTATESAPIGNNGFHSSNPVRIHWTISETTAIAERFAEKIFKQFGAIIPPGRAASQQFLIPWLRESQSEMIACGMLAKNRRREILGCAALPEMGWNIVKLTLGKLELQKENRSEAPKPETPPILPVLPAQPQPSQETTDFGYQKLSDLELIKELFRRFSPLANFDERLKTIEDMTLNIGTDVEKLGHRIGEIEQRTIKFSERVQKKEIADRKDLPVVAIIGFRKDIFHRIEEKCEEEGIACTLRLYELDTKERPVSADRVIYMKHINVGWKNYAKKAVENHPEYCQPILGTLDPVMNQIRAWFPRE